MSGKTTETTSSIFTLEDMKKAKEISGFVGSNSLNIIHAILNNKTISKTVWGYVFEEAPRRQDILIDVLRRIPHTRVVEKKMILDVLIERDYFSDENKVREWMERFVGSEELAKHLLDEVIKRKSILKETTESVKE